MKAYVLSAQPRLRRAMTDTVETLYYSNLSRASIRWLKTEVKAHDARLSTAWSSRRTKRYYCRSCDALLEQRHIPSLCNDCLSKIALCYKKEPMS